MFAVPALIGVLKNDWYARKGSEPVMVKAPTWKFMICNNGMAGKDMVVAALLDRELLSKVEYKQIVKEFSANKRRKDMDPQDCFDAIAIDSYVTLTIERYIKQEGLKIDGNFEIE